MMKNALYFIILIILLNIMFYIMRIIKKYYKKEKILFYKNQFIFNNKYFYDILDPKFKIIITNINILVESKLKYYAITDLELVIIENDTKNKISNLNNALNILKLLKEYNYTKYKEVINKYIPNDLFKSFLDKEIIKYKYEKGEE